MHEHQPAPPTALAPAPRAAVDDRDLQEGLAGLLETVRRQLGMPVVFLTRFGGDSREVQVVAGDHPSVRVGHSDPLDDTYCAGIVGGWIPPVVPDARRDATTRDLPTTAALDIGAYVGVPVALADGTVYGTLCSFSPDPDPGLTLRDAQVLRVVAEAAAGLLSPRLARAARRARLGSELEAMLAAGDPQLVFQPIVSLEDGTPLAVEALSRFSSRHDLLPGAVFDLARTAGRSLLVEQHAVDRALEHLPRLAVPLSLNVSPELLLSPQLWASLSGVPPTSVVLELTEHQDVADYAAVREVVRPWQQRGVRLAIDDAGAGFAGLRHLVQLEPDWVKLDLTLVRGVHTDPRRRAMVAALLAYAAGVGAHVVAEGIEDDAELAALRDLGVPYGQGYALARPCPWDALRAHGLTR